MNSYLENSYPKSVERVIIFFGILFSYWATPRISLYPVLLYLVPVISVLTCFNRNVYSMAKDISVYHMSVFKKSKDFSKNFFLVVAMIFTLYLVFLFAKQQWSR